MPVGSVSVSHRGAADTAAPEFAAKLELLVFDLDGTLIDSKDDLVASVNATLRQLRRPELGEAAIASYVGDGAPALMQRALAASAALAGQIGGRNAGRPEGRIAGPAADDGAGELAEALDHLLRYYDAHKLDRTRLYPGVGELLPRLAGRYRLGVLSNKPVRPAREILEGLGVAQFFRAIYGGNSFAAKKPDPIGLATLLREQRVLPRRALMVGDSEVDIQTGRNARVWTCGVTYGFRPRSLDLQPPDWRIDNFTALDALLESGAPRI